MKRVGGWRTFHAELKDLGTFLGHMIIGHREEDLKLYSPTFTTLYECKVCGALVDKDGTYGG